MRLLYAVLLLSLACSAPGPVYERGTLRPLPARPQPKVGPSYDPHVAPLPPQPNPRPKRLLPPSDRPGIWASDEPMATATPLEIAGVPLPVPEPERSVNLLEKYAPLLCHGLITHNAFSPGHALSGDAFTQEQKACLIAAWYKHCLSWAAEAVVDRKNKGTINIVLGHFWKRYVEPASKFKEQKCTPEILDTLKPHDDFPTHYWDDVLKSYQRTTP